MLVLTRRIGEKLIIGNGEIVVAVLGIQEINDIYQVRLGIDAPKAISVHREEIYDRIQQQRGE